MQHYFVDTKYNHIISYYNKKIKLEFTEQDYEKKKHMIKRLDSTK